MGSFKKANQLAYPAIYFMTLNLFKYSVDSGSFGNYSRSIEQNIIRKYFSKITYKFQNHTNSLSQKSLDTEGFNSPVRNPAQPGMNFGIYFITKTKRPKIIYWNFATVYIDTKYSRKQSFLMLCGLPKMEDAKISRKTILTLQNVSYLENLLGMSKHDLIAGKRGLAIKGINITNLKFSLQ